MSDRFKMPEKLSEEEITQPKVEQAKSKTSGDRGGKLELPKSLETLDELKSRVKKEYEEEREKVARANKEYEEEREKELGRSGKFNYENFNSEKADWVGKFFGKIQNFRNDRKETAKNPEFRADTMKTLKLLREMNKEMRNELQKGESAKAKQIQKEFGEKISKDPETRKEKVLNLMFMLEGDGTNFIKEFDENEPAMTKKEWEEIKEAMEE